MHAIARFRDRWPGRWSFLHVHGWMIAVRVAGWIGSHGERVRARVRPRLLALAVAVAAVLVVPWWQAAAAYLAALLLWLGWNASTSVVVETFEDHVSQPGRTASTAGEASASEVNARVHRPDTTGMAALLATRLAEMRSIYQLLEEPLSAPCPGQPVEGAVQLEDIGDVLRSAFITQPNATVGSVTLPIGPLMTLLGRLMQAPRLRGAFYGDGRELTLSAELSMHGEPHVWSITAKVEPGQTPTQVRAAMVEDLAYRVFTDLSLHGQAEWPATRYWLDALKERQACLRSPRDRRLHLERAEQHLRKALAEDERFYLAAYNLGIVYRQLADDDAQREERVGHDQFRRVASEPHTRSARHTFEHAIEHLDHGRWEAYYGLALCFWKLADDLQYGVERRRRRVVDLCDRALELKPGRAARAQIKDLKATAQSALGDPRAALHTRHRACGAILRELTRAELRQARARDGQHVQRLRHQASQCVLNLAVSYMSCEKDRIVQPDPPLWAWALHRTRFARIRSLARFATRLTDVDASAHIEFAKVAQEWGKPKLAADELRRAMRIDPDDPEPWARLAQVLAHSHDAGAPAACEQARRVIDFAQAADDRDFEPIDLLTDAFEALGDLEHRDEVVRRRQAATEIAAALDLQPAAATERLEALLAEWRQGEAPWEAALVARRLGEHLTERDPARAEEMFTTAIDLLSDQGIGDIRRWGLLGAQASAIAAQEDRTAEALPLAEEGVAIDPLKASAWRALARVREHGGDYEHASTAWGRALLREPNNPARHLDLAECQWQEAEWVAGLTARQELREEALDHLHVALRLYDSTQLDERQRAHWRCARWHWLMGADDELPAHLGFLLAATEELHPSPQDDALRALLEFLLASSYRRTREFVKAERYARAAIEHGDSAARRGLPAATPTDARFDDADWPLGRVRALARARLAGCHADRNGDLAEAEQRCAEAHAIVADLAGSGTDVTATRSAVFGEEGRVALRAGATAKGVALLEDATRLDPGAADMYVALARGYSSLAADQRGAEREATLDLARECCGRVRDLVGEGHADRKAAEEVEREIFERRAEGRTSIPAPSLAGSPDGDGAQPSLFA